MNYLITPPKPPFKREKFFARLKQRWNELVCALNGHEFGFGRLPIEHLTSPEKFIEYLKNRKCSRCGRKFK